MKTHSWFGKTSDGKLVKLADVMIPTELGGHARITSPMAQDNKDGSSVFMIGMVHLEWNNFVAMFEAIDSDGRKADHFYCTFDTDITTFNPIDAGDKPLKWWADKVIEMSEKYE